MRIDLLRSSHALSFVLAGLGFFFWCFRSFVFSHTFIVHGLAWGASAHALHAARSQSTHDRTPPTDRLLSKRTRTPRSRGPPPSPGPSQHLCAADASRVPPLRPGCASCHLSTRLICATRPASLARGCAASRSLTHTPHSHTRPRLPHLPWPTHPIPTPRLAALSVATLLPPRPARRFLSRLLPPHAPAPPLAPLRLPRQQEQQRLLRPRLLR